MVKLMRMLKLFFSCDSLNFNYKLLLFPEFSWEFCSLPFPSHSIVKTSAPTSAIWRFCAGTFQENHSHSISVFSTLPFQELSFVSDLFCSFPICGAFKWKLKVQLNRWFLFSNELKFFQNHLLNNCFFFATLNVIFKILLWLHCPVL